MNPKDISRFCVGPNIQCPAMSCKLPVARRPNRVESCRKRGPRPPLRPAGAREIQTKTARNGRRGREQLVAVVETGACTTHTLWSSPASPRFSCMERVPGPLQSVHLRYSRISLTPPRNDLCPTRIKLYIYKDDIADLVSGDDVMCKRTDTLRSDLGLLCQKRLNNVPLL